MQKLLRSSHELVVRDVENVEGLDQSDRDWNYLTVKAPKRGIPSMRQAQVPWRRALTC